MKRPSTYGEWRKIYQDCIYSLGLLVRNRRTIKASGIADVLGHTLPRRMHEIHHRMDRLELRLQVEHEVKDEDYCRLLMQLGIDPHAEPDDFD